MKDKESLEISYVDSWVLGEREDAHPSHRKAVVEVGELLGYLWELREDRYSASTIFLRLNKELRKVMEEDR